MDFEFSEEQKAFAAEVEAFLDANHDPDVFDLSRENMAQLVDTPERRAFMKEMGRKGWLGITWPAEYGGSEGEGVYEYLLNEALAARGGPQIGKGCRHRRQDDHRPRVREAEGRVPAHDPRERRGVRGGLLGARRRVRRRLHATEEPSGTPPRTAPRAGC